MPHVIAQTDGFVLHAKNEKAQIKYLAEGNLILIPVNINGTELRFVLDSGVAETILFSSSLPEDVSLNDVETIQLKGLGNKDATTGLKSKSNFVSIADVITDQNHTIIVVPDEDLNLSAQIGVPVHGMIGFAFFKNYPIEINQKKKLITLYRTAIPDRKLKKYQSIPIELHKKKPYILDFGYNNKIYAGKLLIDLGNAGALWLFGMENQKIELPVNSREEYLGHGFSGLIYGAKGITTQFSAMNFNFNDVVTSFPNENAVINAMIEDRMGSVGNEIMRRFHAFYDYPNQKIYLKPNSSFDDLFTYNKSGVEVILDSVRLERSTMILNTDRNIPEIEKIRYIIEEIPTFKIGNLNPKSDAAKAGLQIGDYVLRINNKYASKHSLKTLRDELQKKEGTKIKMLIERDKKKIWIVFYLTDIFELD